jgi:hypothetical protein
MLINEVISGESLQLLQPKFGRISQNVIGQEVYFSSKLLSQ